MGDTVDDFRAIAAHKRRLRERFGVPCPECRRLQPKRHPTILLPQQRCRIDRYVDPRPELTNEQWSTT